MVRIILKEFRLDYNYYSNLTNFYLGVSIFKSYSRPNENNKDPFRPVELNNHKNSDGAPLKPSAKPKKPSRILKTSTSQSEHHDVFPSEQKRNTEKYSQC